VTRKPLGPKGQMVSLVHVTHKPSGPIGRMEMEKGVIGSHKLDREGSTSTCDMQAVESHRWMNMEKGPIGSGFTGRMEKGPIGTHRMKKGSSEDFYDELQAPWMSNYRSHRYSSDGEGIVWRSMTKHHHYRSNIVHHRSIISIMMKLVRHSYE